MFDRFGTAVGVTTQLQSHVPFRYPPFRRFSVLSACFAHRFGFVIFVLLLPVLLITLVSNAQISIGYLSQSA